MIHSLKEVLKLAMLIGQSLQIHGAETYRVEESIIRVLKAYGAREVEVFSITHFISISALDEEGNHYHLQKRIFNRVDSLNKLSLINHSLREICEERPDPKEALEQIKTILAEKGYSSTVQILATSIAGLGFTYTLGGSFQAAIYACLISALARVLILPLQKRQVNRIFINILGSAIITALALPSFFLGLKGELDFIVTGAFMFLFPGLSLMNSIRDIISSDYLAGITKLLEAVLVALSLAVGSGLVLAYLPQLIHLGGA